MSETGRGAFLGFVRRVVPEWAVDAVVRYKGPVAHQIAAARAAAESLWGGPLPTDSESGQRSEAVIGILADRAGYFTFNLLACRERGVPFRVVNLEASDWVEEVRRKPCRAYLAWPSTNLSIWKDLWDERVSLLRTMTGRPICPTPEELWLLESKRRVRDWLESHDVSSVSTEVFYDESAAMAFASRCELPIVLKTNAGASSHGVWVFRDRARLRRAVRKAFGGGLRTKRGDARDRSWGHVILQKYVPHEHEWRVVRIGSSYLCRRKTRKGDFASGQGVVEWAEPSIDLLDFAESVTDRGGFTSMALDVFAVSAGGRAAYVVNEMQCLIGAAPEGDHSLRGRWLRGEDGWRLERGDFYRNACANLRVDYLLEKIEQDERNRKSGPVVA